MKQYFSFQWHITDECDQRCKHCYIFSENCNKKLDAMSWQEMQDTFYNCLDFVRMVRAGLVQLFTGQASMSDMTGVVGMVDIINETGQSAQSTSEGIANVVFLVAFIAVNLAVMNLLPLPALDGGHILTLLLSALFEKITGKKPDPRIEGYIHYIGLLLLLGLMVLLMYNDIVRIIRR